VEELFDGPASACEIVVAVGLSFVIPMVFAVCPGRRDFGSVTTLGFDAGPSRESSGEVKLVSVESATVFLTCWRCETLGKGDGGSKGGRFSGEVSGDVRKLVSVAAAITGA